MNHIFVEIRNILRSTGLEVLKHWNSTLRLTKPTQVRKGMYSDWLNVQVVGCWVYIETKDWIGENCSLAWMMVPVA